jgi:hypothetical protein
MIKRPSQAAPPRCISLGVAVLLMNLKQAYKTVSAIYDALLADPSLT